MSVLAELDVVNDCIGTLGELPVNALDDDHPLIAAARRAFRTCLTREMGKQWWFNTEVVELVKDSDDYIWTPGDAIRCDPIKTKYDLVQRGRRLYDPGTTTGNAGYKMTLDRVVCWLVRNVPFEDLPPSAQIVVGVSTQLKFMVAYDADPQKYRQLLSEYQEAYMTLNAEHIRNMDANLLYTNPLLVKLLPIGGIRQNRLPTFR